MTEVEDEQSAKIEFTLGGEAQVATWKGERGKPPFTRMSIFDSPSVNFHVDDDLEYVYVPVALALFNHVIAGIREVQTRIDATKSQLMDGTISLLNRFPKDASIYPLIETLGAATDLEDLRARADNDPKVGERIDSLRKAVAALEANTIDSQIVIRQRTERVLALALTRRQHSSRI